MRVTPDAEAVNGGAVPHIDDVWAGVVKAECKVALQSAKQVYMDAMAAVRERLPQEEEVCGCVAVWLCGCGGEYGSVGTAASRGD